MPGFAHPGLYALITAASLPLQASAGAAVSATSALQTVRPGPETPILPRGGGGAPRPSPLCPPADDSFRMAFAGVWSCFCGAKLFFVKKSLAT